MSNINAAIFDMDGVIVNSEEVYFEQLMDFYRKKKLTPSSTCVNDYIGASNEHVWQQLVQNPVLRERLRHEYLDFDKAHPVDYPSMLADGAVGLLRYLKSEGYLVALASAGIPRDIRLMVHDCELTGYFDFIISGEEVQNNKPEPDIYLKAAKELGVSPDHCIVFEDSEKGIQAAKSAGMRVWAIRHPEVIEMDQSKADRIIQDLTTARNLLCELS